MHFTGYYVYILCIYDHKLSYILSYINNIKVNKK